MKRRPLGRSPLAATAAALAAAVLAWAPPAQAEEAPASTAGQPVVESLHDPGKRSHYAFVDQRTRVRAQPDWTAPVVGKLRLRTEDGTDELVLVLERTVDRDGREWLHVRLPVRPNGTTGWVPASTLGTLRRVHTWVIVDRATLRLRLVRDGRVVFRAPVGVGERRYPTPAGEFYVRNRLSGFPPGSIYGPLAFGTSARSVLTDWPGGGVVGIHGTNQPRLLPGRVSHGCIRMRNRDILRLGRLLPVGTPLTIR